MKSTIKKILTPLFSSFPLLAIFLTCPFVFSIQAEVIDRVVAEVNEDVITLSEVEEEGQAVFQRIIREASPEERDAIIAQARQEILESIIDKTLIAQQAEKHGVTVTDEELDAAIEQILAANDITREILLDDLDKNGLDEQTYRSNLRSQLYQNKLVSIDVRSKVVVTEEMMLDYYDSEYTRHVSEGGYYLLQIGTSWEKPDNPTSNSATEADKRAALEQAERIHKLAKGGQDFRDLALKFSDLPSGAEGGDIGVFTEEEMASYMKDTVLTLKAGQISPIVETPVGYQFFKLLSSNEGGIVMQAPYETVKDEIKERLYGELMKKEFDEWIGTIRKQAYVRRL